MSSKRKDIIVFRPRDLRIDEPSFTNESENVITGKLGENTLRIFKHEPMWSGEKRTLILACEGSPLTASVKRVKGDRWVTIRTFLEELWTAEVVAKLPPQLLEPLEEKWYSQITVVPADIEEAAVEPLSKVKADNILWESNVHQLNEVGKHTEEKNMQENITDFILKAATGGFIVLILVMRGVLKV